MITHRHITNSKIFETAAGVILFAVAAGAQFAPTGILDNSGESYIFIAILIVIGGWLLIDGLFNEDQSSGN